MKRILEQIADGVRGGHVDPGFGKDVILGELSPSQRSFLDLVRGSGPLTSTEIVEQHYTHLSLQAAANVLGELNRLGVVERETDEGDPRSYRYRASQTPLLGLHLDQVPHEQMRLGSRVLRRECDRFGDWFDLLRFFVTPTRAKTKSLHRLDAGFLFLVRSASFRSPRTAIRTAIANRNLGSAARRCW